MLDQPIFIGSEIYRGSSYGRWHPLRVPRVSTVMDLCRALGWLELGQYKTSPIAKPAALSAWHTADYVAAVARVEQSQTATPEDTARHALGTVSNPVFPDMYRRPATGVGGVLLAGELLADGGIVHVPGGGTHHALPDAANGFCYFNDPVFAIQSMRRNGAPRIAYIDIDAHHCDGVDHGFRDDPDTLLISTHEAGRWPRTGPLDDAGLGNVFNLPVPRGFNDTEMSLVVREMILPTLDWFKPDGVVLQCGSDALLEDPQSRLALSNRAYFDAVHAIMGATSRLMVLGGGGYNPWSVGRCWSGIWATLNGIESVDDLPVSAQEVLRGLEWCDSRHGKNPPLHWFNTLRDQPRFGPITDDVSQGVSMLRARLV